MGGQCHLNGLVLNLSYHSLLKALSGQLENDVPLCSHHKAGSFFCNTPVLEGALSLNSLLPPGGQLPPERASTLWLLFLKQ